jgi:hypothetical protein
MTPPSIPLSTSPSRHPLSPGRGLHLGDFWRLDLGLCNDLDMASLTSPLHWHASLASYHNLQHLCFSLPSFVVPFAPSKAARGIQETGAWVPLASMWASSLMCLCLGVFYSSTGATAFFVVMGFFLCCSFSIIVSFFLGVFFFFFFALIPFFICFKKEKKKKKKKKLS